ncbi:MAG: sigma-70 family RNA polymerase sigma factor [Bryobacteraceae bacterium]
MSVRNRAAETDNSRDMARAGVPDVRVVHAMSESGSASPAKSGLVHAREDRLRGHLSRVREGSEDALAALYDETSSLVYSIAVRILGDRADAEEVTLDVYSQIWRAASGFQAERGTVTGWMTTMTRSRAIDRMRARGRRSEQSVESLCDEPAAAPSPEQSTVVAQQRRFVQAALAALPPDQRRVIELAWYGGYTQAELADRMGLPLGTIKTRIRLGLMKLRELLSALGELAP